MTRIVPTLLAITEEQYQEGIEKIKACSGLHDEWVQIDLMDNKFVPNMSIGLDVVAKYPLTHHKEAQLMVVKPEEWMSELKNLDFKRVIFPAEIGNTEQYINDIQGLSMEVGISVNPETTISQIEQFLDKIQLVLIMGVNPGFQGQTFIPEVLGKIKELANLKSRHDFLIGVDGGVNLENAKNLVEAGVDNLAIGSALFKGDFYDNFKKFQEIVNT